MKLALTFDTEFPGRPTSPGVEERILAALDAAGAKATFFLQGRWTRANPETARRIVEDERVLAALEELGYRHIGWDVDPRDWEEGRTAEELERLVLEATLEDTNDKTLLLHAWPIATAEALPLILAALGAKSVDFAPAGSI